MILIVVYCCSYIKFIDFPQKIKKVKFMDFIHGETEHCRYLIFDTMYEFTESLEISHFFSAG